MTKLGITRRGAALDIWEWAQVFLLLANLMWTTLCLGGYRPETMVVTSALNGILAAVHLLGFFVLRPERPDGSGAVLRVHPAGWLLLPFLVYAAANVVWVTDVPWLGWRDWLGWLQAIALFWVVLNGVRSTAARAVVFWSIVAIAFVAVLLACYQRFANPEWLMLGRVQANHFIGRASGPFGIPNSLAALLLLVFFPLVALALKRGASAVQRVFFGYLALVFAFGLVLTISRGAWLAALLVFVAWPVLVARTSWWRRLLLGGAAFAGLLAVIAILFATVPLVRERLTALKTDAGEKTRPIMWRGAWDIFEEAPVWGSGAGSYNTVFEQHRPENFQDEPVWAHNDYLNTLSDYGAVGFLLFFGPCCWIAWRCAWRNYPNEVNPEAAEHDLTENAVARFRSGIRRRGSDTIPLGGIVAGLAAFALQLFVDFHLKIPALAMAFATLAGLAVQRRWPAGWSRSERGAAIERDFCVVAGTFVLGGAIWFASPLYRAEALRYAARQSIDRLAIRGTPVDEWQPVLTDAIDFLTRATRLDVNNGATWADLSYATALLAIVEPKRAKDFGAKAERFAVRALACASIVPEFWVRRGVALDLQGRRIEAGRPFVHALQLAPANATMWYYQAAHLSLDTADPARALAAVTFCLRLDPGKREAQALRQRLAERSRAP